MRCSARAFCMATSPSPSSTNSGTRISMAKKSWNSGGGFGAQELAPDRDRRTKAEQRAHVELGRCDDIDDTSAFDLERVALLAEGQREGRREPVADHGKLGIGVHPLAIPREPGVAGIVVHGLRPTSGHVPANRLPLRRNMRWMMS